MELARAYSGPYKASQRPTNQLAPSGFYVSKLKITHRLLKQLLFHRKKSRTWEKPYLGKSRTWGRRRKSPYTQEKPYPGKAGPRKSRTLEKTDLGAANRRTQENSRT
jgi:hypothetical protein